MGKPIQDTIDFTLTAEDTVVSNTVKVVANIVGMISPSTTEQELRNTIRGVMRQFIETDWQFSNMTRPGHASGLEQISLIATARVSEAENYALDRRREEACRDVEGIRIVSVTTDTAPTLAQLAETQQKLRLSLLKQAQTELRLINETLGETLYRLGAISFGQSHDTLGNRPQTIAVAASAKMSYGTGFSDNDDTIGNAVKLTMHADIQLRISR